MKTCVRTALESSIPCFCSLRNTLSGCRIAWTFIVVLVRSFCQDPVCRVLVVGVGLWCDVVCPCGSFLHGCTGGRVFSRPACWRPTLSPTVVLYVGLHRLSSSCSIFVTSPMFSVNPLLRKTLVSIFPPPPPPPSFSVWFPSGGRIQETDGHAHGGSSLQALLPHQQPQELQGHFAVRQFPINRIVRCVIPRTIRCYTVSCNAPNRPVGKPMSDDDDDDHDDDHHHMVHRRLVVPIYITIMLYCQCCVDIV